MRALRVSNVKSNIEKIKYNFLVFDTETTCLEPQPKNFVFGCLYGYKVRKVFYTVEEFKIEFKKPQYKNKYIFAHNAEFDLLTIFGNIFTKIDNAAIFNGKFISAKMNDVTFADSMNVYPTSVVKLGNLINLPKLENKKASSGQLRKNNIDTYDVEYCYRDCEIVFKALLKIFELTGAIRITLPSLAMFDFRHNYLEEDLCFSELVDDFYESYYGGRTEAFRLGACKAKSYDINSLYPKAMTQVSLPDVKHLQKTENCDVSYLIFCMEHYEGMCRIEVDHTNTYFGYLPCRMKINKTTKLCFPVGTFITTVNFNELRFAIQQGVVRIKKVYSVVYGAPIKSLFTSYINDNYSRRKETKDELEKTIYKLKMNSLYGRFAMRVKMNTTYYEQVPYDLITKIKEADKYCDIKLFNAFRADCFLVTENEQFKNAFFSIPAISSYITSEARIILLKNLIANERNGVVYCDTDSIFLSGDFIGNISDKLGDFKQESKQVTEVRGLKNYTYIDDKDGKTYNVIKGVSRGSTEKKSEVAGEKIFESERYYKTKASLRGNHEAGARYTMVKTIRNNYDKREILSDGNTNPLKCKDNILINATTYKRTHKKIKSKKRFRYEPENMREAIMMFFINGGKIRTKDLQSHVTGNSNEELKHYFGLYAADGQHMDVFYEQVPDEFYTDRIIDIFQDVLLTYNTAGKMREALEALAAEREIKTKAQVKEYEFAYENTDDVPF
jgi:hypothetical protein